MLQRLTDPEIAARLGLSSRTVEQHAREVRRKLGLRRRRSLSHLPSAFTVREREVGQLLAQGLSAKEIAERLGVSERTAETTPWACCGRRVFRIGISFWASRSYCELVMGVAPGSRQ
jgi:DNA-binding CsgD family transcriptional regulator